MFKQTKKNNTSKKSEIQTSGVRLLRKPKRRWYKPGSWFVRTMRPVRPKVATSIAILRNSIKLLRLTWKPAVGVAIVYALGVLVFARGLSVGQDMTSIKQTLDSLFTGTGGHAQSLFVEFMVLFNSSNTTTNAGGGFFQAFLLIMCTLAIIWVFRQANSGTQPTTKAAFYNGMYPLAQFILVLLAISIQAIPLLLGSYLYSMLIANGIAVHAIEIFLSFLIIILLITWSLRMLMSSFFALYIVSLPGMTPVRALRSAKELVIGRRMLVVRKIVLLPVVLLLASVIVIVPFLLLWPPVAAWVFYTLSAFALVASNAYMYTIYKELIKDE